MSTSCYCLSVRTGAFLSIAWSVVYSTVQIAYVVTQEWGKSTQHEHVHNKEDNTTSAENESHITQSNVSNDTADDSPNPSSSYPSVLMPDGWDGDVLSHVHLLLLVVYLSVFISCMTLLLGIYRVGFNTYSLF